MTNSKPSQLCIHSDLMLIALIVILILLHSNLYSTLFVAMDDDDDDDDDDVPATRTRSQRSQSTNRQPSSSSSAAAARHSHHETKIDGDDGDFVHAMDVATMEHDDDVSDNDDDYDEDGVDRTKASAQWKKIFDPDYTAAYRANPQMTKTSKGTSKPAKKGNYACYCICFFYLATSHLHIPSNIDIIFRFSFSLNR